MFVKRKKARNIGLFRGAAQRIRTADLFLTKEVLCLLS